MPEGTLDEAVLKTWIGRSETASDVIDAGRARLMQATLDREPSLRDGDALPPLWHWLYFLQPTPLGALDLDGHAKRGGFLPPVDLPRRMWAGGRFAFSGPVRLGEVLTRTSTVEDVAVKRGRSGPLCFVTVRHDFAGPDGGLRLREEHDIVYRGDPAPGAASAEPSPAPEGGVWSTRVVPSPVLLFRYSALTFNAHRIHYDRDYCREVEGYPGLVFHGPLTATLLADLVVRVRPEAALRGFSFRAVAPLFDGAPFMLRGKSAAEGTLALWAETPEGGLAMRASADVGG